MSMPRRANLWPFAAVASVFAITALFCSLPAAAASATDLQVIDVSPSARAADAANAYAAFASGSAIIRMTGGSPEAFATLFNVPIAEVTISTQTGSNPTYFGPSGGTPSKLQAIAAYIDANGILHSALTFAPDSSSAAGNATASTASASTWQSDLDNWIAQQQSNARLGLAGAALGDPTPPDQAWTLLYTTTIVNDDGNGSQQTTQGFYRLNTVNPQNDYYMVTNVPQTTAPYNGYCDGLFYCGWHTIERDFEIDGPAVATLVDHGPTGTIGSGTQSFTIGGNVGPDGPGVNASFSFSWNQQDVATVDHSTNQSALWQETFQFNDAVKCLPAFGTLPAVSSGTFLSRQGAIFQVPGGMSSVSFPTTTKSEFCLYTSAPTGGQSQGNNYEWNTIQTNFPIGPPVLSAYPNEMSIPAGGSAPLLVNALIPFSNQGLVWNITSNQLWLTTPSSGPFSTGQAIPVSVAADAPKGGTATLSINTSPPFAAPSVESGPILVNVTVGTPQASTPAGILLFGGRTSPNTPAEFYSLTAKQSFPVKANIPYRLFHTATLLKTGKILIVGGATAPLPSDGSPAPVTATAELFDPAALTFANTGTLATARYGHTATLLTDGKVLIFGGIDASGQPLASAELYDPATGTFSNAGTLPTPRAFLTASLITLPASASQVLLYGGTTKGQFAPDNGYEVWDEAKKGIASEGTMPAASYLIPQPLANSDGLLDLIGGLDTSGNVTAQEQLLNLNEPYNVSFQLGQPLNVARVWHTLTALPGGDLLVTGGNGADGATVASAEIRDSEGWHLLSGTASCPGNPGCMLYPRNGHTATLLPDGTVFIAGGSGNTQSEIYNPAQKTFSAGPQILTRYEHTATLVVGTATNLLVSPPSSDAGQNVQLSATVTSAVGTPSGSVQFLDGSTVLGTVTLSTGQASMNIATLAVGPHSLSAAYSGDGLSSASASPVVTLQVGKGQTTTALSSAPNPSTLGQPIAFTASVTSSVGTVTGQVTFKDGPTVLGSSPLVKGAAQFQTDKLSVGPRSITATYGGDSGHAASTSTAVVQTVDQAATTTTMESVPATRFGQPVQLRATVKAGGSLALPTGSVIFKDGQTSLGSAALNNGLATLQVSSLGAGSHSITATYSGDSTYGGSVSQPVTVTVTQEGTNVTITSSPNPSNAQQTVTFSATVTAKDQNISGVPTGSVVFSDGANQLGTGQLTGGKASFTTSSLAAGKHSITAAYSGDANFLSGSSRLDQTVNAQRQTTTTTLSSSLNPSALNQSVTFTAAVTSSSGTPTGTVTFKDNGTSIGSGTLVNGTASLTTTALSGGPHQITATYGGDANFLESTSAPLTQTVNSLAPVTATITSNPNPSTVGQTVVFKVVISSTAGGTPTGSITVSETTSTGSITYGSAQLINGAGIVSESDPNILTSGSHEIYVTYGGDSTHQSLTSPPYVQHVNPDSAALGGVRPGTHF